MKTLLIASLLLSSSLAVLLVPSASATCLVGTLACTCGIEPNDPCGYDQCAIAIVPSLELRTGVGVSCRTENGYAPVVLYYVV